MVEKSVKVSSKKNTTPLDIINQLLASKSLARRNNLKHCGNNKGDSRSPKSNDDLSEDLSDISDTEVAGYLSNSKEFLLKKIAWETMNSDYQKGKRKKPITRKKKEPKTARGKKTSATKTESNVESGTKKVIQRPNVELDFDALDELFDTEKSPKRTKLENPVVVSDQIEECVKQSSEEEGVLKPQVSEEGEELDWNNDYSNEDAYGGTEEFYGDEDHEFENQDEGEYDEGIIW